MIDRIGYSAPSYIGVSRVMNPNSGQVVEENSVQPPASADSAVVNSPARVSSASVSKSSIIPFPGQQVCLGNRQTGSDTTISAATAAYGKTADDTKISDKLLKRLGLKECQTCNERRYQDESNDPGVSFKAPTHIAPENAGAAVAAHEQEHVRNQQAKAAREEKQVVSQSVQIFTATCPECGKVYVSGGETRTVTMTKSTPVNDNSEKGKMIDRYA